MQGVSARVSRDVGRAAWFRQSAPGGRIARALVLGLVVATAVGAEAPSRARDASPASAAYAPRGGPYVPVTDDEVLERLPPGANAAEARRRRQELADDPENLRDSVELAGSYLATAEAEGDPRMRGLAREILSPWWDSPSPPAPVLLVRARVRMLEWEFERALADLPKAGGPDPVDAEAGALRMELWLGRGDLASARGEFERSSHRWPKLRRAILEARLARFRPGAAAAISALEPVLLPGISSTQRGMGEAWALWIDLLLQAGRRDEAWKAAEQARESGIRDVALECAWAEMAMERGEARAVVDAFSDRGSVDALAIRRLQAWALPAGRGKDDASERDLLLNQVTRRLEARRLRADASVLPEDVAFLLRLARDPQGAWRTARGLWAVRRMPGDLRLVLEAAAAARAGTGVAPVVEWMRREGYVDARLQGVLESMGGVP